jgi:DNA-binding SARP family transcriptional activator/tetratricopeptide (TPR) repeat protein
MLRLLTLGGLSLVDDGVPVTGAASQRSRLALLAVLAAAGPAGVSRDKLLALLWPESDDERARHALKQGVYALRRDLGNENAIVGTATLSLEASVVASDIREFDDAIARGDDTAALAVYSGPFLDGVFVKAAPEFDQWAAGERSRLERAHLDAIGRLARTAEAAGDTPAAVQWWRRAAAAEPLSGRVALSLMRALADSGDVSAAIQHARVHDAMVRGELDSPADDAVLALAEQLRSGEYVPNVRTPIARTSAEAVVAKDDSPEAARMSAAAAILSSEPDAESPVPRTPTGEPSPWRQRMISAFVVLLGLGLATTLIPGVRSRIGAMLPGAHSARSYRRIVVATFENQTGDSSLNRIGEHASDWLARTLLEADFEVVDGRTSATIARMIARITPAGNAHDRAVALAVQTGAATVVTGSYYKQGDSLWFEAKILDPTRGVLRHAVGPISGPASAATSVVGLLAKGVTEAMAGSSAATAGASTASLVEPPSLEAFEHTSRAWEMFFANPVDTMAVFTELARASATDTMYTAPLLMRGYVLDVKENWPGLASVVKTLEPRRARMGRIEREVLTLFQADLAGDLLGRLRASRELVRLSPGSPDMLLLLAVSASYVNRAAEARDALLGSSPDRGINRVSPMYWVWRAASEHALELYDDELASGTQELRRFPSSPFAAMAFTRSYAARGNVRALDSLLARVGLTTPTPSPGALKLALLGARELRAHGHDREAAALFARVASIAPRRGATREENELHAFALYEAKDFAGARAAYTALVSRSPGDVDLLGRLEAIAARTNDSAAVKAIEQRLSQLAPAYDLGRRNYWRAHLAALLGRGSQAVSFLHEAIAQGYRPVDIGTVSLHEDGDFAGLWKDQAFRELVRPRDGALALP